MVSRTLSRHQQPFHTPLRSPRMYTLQFTRSDCVCDAGDDKIRENSRFNGTLRVCLLECITSGYRLVIRLVVGRW